jgi:DNA-binding MurR/RpiR family transcriptional regulator
MHRERGMRRHTGVLLRSVVTNRLPVRASNYDELKQLISTRYPAMSKQLQAIARFALERPDELALGTVAAIAGAAGVQPSAMVRFANALDFGGFTEMQQIFRGRLVERSVSYRERIEQIRRNAGNGADADTPAGVLHRLVGDAIGELGHLEEAITAAQFDAAIRLLVAAPQIHVLAQRRAFPVACYLAYALSQLELRTHLLDSVGGMLGEFVRGIAPREALNVVSFRN